VGQRGLELAGDDAGDHRDVVGHAIEDHQIGRRQRRALEGRGLAEAQDAVGHAGVERLVGLVAEDLVGGDRRDSIAQGRQVALLLG
jgi:hypothetical protein